MALITLSQIQLAFGHVALLDHVDFSLQPLERVGLIGRNGAGKSSFLKLLAGLQKADDGLLQQQQGLRCAYVAQEADFDPQATVFDTVALPLAKVRIAREQYEALGADPDADMDALTALQDHRQGGFGDEKQDDDDLKRRTAQPMRLDEVVARLHGAHHRVVVMRAAVRISGEPHTLVRTPRYMR